jgi:FtsZ-binding cell division protein ZapB
MTRVRIFDARTAAVHAKILALERALSAAQMNELTAHRPKLMEQILDRLNSDKSDFQSRREEWQARLNAALGRLSELRNISDQGATAKAEKPHSESKPNSKPEYRSEMKRAIRMLLTISGDITDLQICRLFDKDGMVDLPEGWKTGNNRSFEIAYKERQHRPKIEKMISKVRTDLYNIGILK